MIGGFPGLLAGLGAVNQGANLGAIQAATALRQLYAAQQDQQALQQQQQWQQAVPIAYQSIGQLGQPPTGGQQATGQDVASAASGYQPGAVQSYPVPPLVPQVPSYGGAMPPTSAAFGTGQGPSYVDGVGPGMKSGQMPWSKFAPIMQRDESGGRNVPNYRFDEGHTASGLNQITDSTWNRYAPAVGAPQLNYPASPMDRPEAEQNRVGEAIYNKEGPGPWANYNPVLARDIQMKTRRIGAIAGPDIAEATHNIANAAAQTVDPATYGRQQIEQMKQAIEGVAPGAPAAVKFMALGMISKILQPADQMALRVQMQQNQDAFKLALQELKGEQGIAAANVRADAAEAGLGERTRHDMAMEDIDRSKQAAGAGTEKLEASKPFDVVDDKGKVVRSIMARERRDQSGFIDSETGQPIKLEQGQHLKQITPSTSGGGRAGAQIIRQEVGGREVLSDLQNAVSLPVGTTIGPLGTVHPGTSVLGALQGDLVRKITDQDSQLMQASMASMTRELSILMSPVYGGNWAAQQIDPLVPKTGDTLGTVLFKLARLAQSADNALEAVSKSPILSNEQQQYANDLKTQIGQAIPWTPAQALEFSHRGQGPKQSFGDFVGKNVTGQGGGGIPKVDAQGNEIKP